MKSRRSPRTTKSSSGRVVIVGGGIAGLAAALRLAQAGIPVTVLEAANLGEGASTRNQGWLHSGAWFAPQRPELAQMCYQSLQRTIEFCPESVAENPEPMLYLLSRSETDPARWTEAWDVAGIPYQSIRSEQLFERLPGIAISQVQHAFELPDRSLRIDRLLRRLAAATEDAGGEIRSASPVARLVYEKNRVLGVELNSGEQIAAGLVILAGNAKGGGLFPGFGTQAVGADQEVALIPLKTHLVGFEPLLSPWPLCVVDADGLNHIPHPPLSVFGTHRWLRVQDSEDQRIVPEEIERIVQHVQRLFPAVRSHHQAIQWAGNTVQAMKVDDVEAAQFPLPLVIDHQQEWPAVENLVSIFPGRATLWAPLADATAELVRTKLSGAQCEVARPPWMATPETMSAGVP